MFGENRSNGSANYAFEGLKNGGQNISTFGIRSVAVIAKNVLNLSLMFNTRRVKMITYKILDLDEHETEILLKDEDNELLCLSFVDIGKIDKLDIHGFMSKKIFRNDNKDEKAVKLPGYFSYKLFCKVINYEKSIVSLGEFKITLDSPLPSDIKNGDYIEFEVMRLDIF